MRLVAILTRFNNFYISTFELFSFELFSSLLSYCFDFAVKEFI